jgi:CHASE2 domain-containing sensor protein
MIIVTILDLVYVFPNTIQMMPPIIEALSITIISLISFVLGIVARFQKESKKALPTVAIVISGLILIAPITGLIKGIFLRLSM